MTVQLRVLRGAACADVLPALADLRITVFREWPYLYEGDRAYEHRYLECYRDCDESLVVLAEDAGIIVGAATGMPAQKHADVAEAYAALEPKDGSVFYCAESVLLPNYRGQGLGHAFFDAREDHARALGATHTSFCGVVRPRNHPMRPTNARDLGPFWRKRGYTPVPGHVLTMGWRDIGHVQESDKTLQIWMRSL